MGYLAKRRQRMVDEITKALQPSIAATAGAAAAGVVTDARPLIDALSSYDRSGQNWGGRQEGTDLPWREPIGAFGPGVPVGPKPFDPRLPDTDRALPRRYEFPVSWNIPGQGQPLTPFNILRRFADQVDVVRLCIGVRKKELSAVNWSIGVKKSLVRQRAAASNESISRMRAQIHDDSQGEIDRITAFFEKPDRINRLSFSEWMFQLLEEVFVLDALSIYPHPALDGTLHSLEILDGATIKPLLDHRGAFPQPPQPAYQQLIWAFPRGEFTLSSSPDGAGDTMTTDELIYKPRERRSWTPYGFSAAEQALIAGDLYMKRQAWLRSEYSDGAVPAALMVPPEALNWSPEQVRQYEANINADLAGQTQQRMRWRLTPPGVNMEFPGDWAERYNANLDEYCIKLLCGFFDVMPSEIGFTPQHGLGGAGHQEGEQASVQRIGNRPMLEWVADILNDVMRTYLNAPPELTFIFDLDESEDETVKSKVVDLDLRNGKRTLNDVRADDGLPLYDFPEADEPFLATPTGPVFLKGMLEQHTAAIESSIAGHKQSVDIAEGRVEDPKLTAAKLTAATLGAGGTPEEKSGVTTVPSAPKPTKDAIAKKAELATFVKFAGKKRATWRDFEFEHLDEDDALRLNELGSVGAVDVLKAAVADLGKATARRTPGARSHRALVKHFTDPIAQALIAAFPHVDHVIRHAMEGRAAITKAADKGLENMFESEMDSDALTDTMRELWANAYAAGSNSALSDLGLNPTWDTWTPGIADAAVRIGGPGLSQMLSAADINIKSVLDSKVEQLANRLSYAIDNGWSMKKTADDISSVLSDPSRAEMIATTETNRAMTSATLDEYHAHGVEEIDWELSDEACELCQENADAGPISINDEWPNGDPPVHPWCACALKPVIDTSTSEETTTDEG